MDSDGSEWLLARMDDLWGSPLWSGAVALRREFHRWPEPGFQEFKTQARVLSALEKYAGIPADCVAEERLRAPLESFCG